MTNKVKAYCVLHRKVTVIVEGYIDNKSTRPRSCRHRCNCAHRRRGKWCCWSCLNIRQQCNSKLERIGQENASINASYPNNGVHHYYVIFEV